jgi:AcrR family transcriptional regulator
MTAERLFREQGYAATGVAQIIEESGSPKGSFYFHFPGGKRQLAMEATTSFADKGRQLISHLANKASGDPRRFIELLCDAFAAEMRHGEYAPGCLLQNLSNELALVEPEIARLTWQSFKDWTDLIEEVFQGGGVASPRDVALSFIAALEGARTLARANRNAESFKALKSTFGRLVSPSAEQEAAC